MVRPKTYDEQLRAGLVRAAADRIAVRDWTRRDTGRLIAKSSPGPVGVAGADDPLYRLPGWPPGTAQTLPPTRR